MKLTIKTLAAALLCLIVAACDVVSTRKADTDAVTGLGCKTSGGDYGLALSKLRIMVEEDRDPDYPAGGLPNTTVLTSAIQQDVYKDERVIFCLDFLTSFFSADELDIQTDKKTQLLSSITVNAEDKLPDAVEGFSQGLASLADPLRAGNNKLPPLKAIEEFIPLNSADMAVANSRLRDFGFCVLVRRRSAANTVSLDALEKQHCHKAVNAEQLTSLIKAASEPPAPLRNLSDTYKNALLYRPTVAVDVYVMWQPRRAVDDEWVIYEKRVISVIDPETIHAIDIRRALFTTRKTELKFTAGVLTDISIDKGSEVAGFVSIPLNILRAIFALPTELISIKIGENNKMQDLIRSRAELAVAEAELKAKQDELTTAQSVANTRNAFTVGLRSGTVTLPQCVAACQSTDRDSTSCTVACQCLQTQCQEGDIACQNACFN
ncbi:MAG: hypothetical protein AAFX07_10105 [Pseudomonadota bacterium]